jgi:hypothetical protein
MCDSLLLATEYQVDLLQDEVTLSKAVSASLKAGIAVKESIIQLQESDLQMYRDKLRIGRRNNFIIYAGVAAGVVVLIMTR